jgi:hypothetical protein
MLYSEMAKQIADMSRNSATKKSVVSLNAEMAIKKPKVDILIDFDNDDDYNRHDECTDS